MLQKKELVPGNDRVRAELVQQTRQFREWVVSTASSELLVHALGGSARWAKLAFFCGSHLGGDAHTRGRSSIRSFISQFLRQEDSFNTSQLSAHVELRSVKRGDVRELCELFGWFLRNMRGDSVVVLLTNIDNIKYYERDEPINVMRLQAPDHEPMPDDRASPGYRSELRLVQGVNPSDGKS
ncbi:hypothetical protein PG997_014539 [Apiospora hydei]|uniref:Uncharacterized protein n=1 Tax=Apiospora hydei TaxID=1337664 RepID=A0ABR1UU71_9PEZI